MLASSKISLVCWAKPMKVSPASPGTQTKDTTLVVLYELELWCPDFEFRGEGGGIPDARSGTMSIQYGLRRGDQGHLMISEHIASRSEMIGAIVSGRGPCLCGHETTPSRVTHRPDVAHAAADGVGEQCEAHESGKPSTRGADATFMSLSKPGR